MLNKEVVDYLKQIYISDPCGSQPSALWKVLDLSKDAHCEISVDKGTINYLLITCEDKLITYFSSSDSLLFKDISKYKFALLNSKYLIDDSSYLECERYFKKVYTYEKSGLRPIKCNDVKIMN